MIEPKALAQLKFPEAAMIWLDSRLKQIGPGSVRDYQLCINALLRFFSELKLEEIHIGHFEQYQKLRSEGAADRGIGQAGPSRVNHELNTLSQILGRAGLRTTIVPYYKPMRLPRPNRQRVIQSDEEKQHLFKVASTRRKWRVAYFASLLTVNTTAHANEIRHLRLSDIDLQTPRPRIHVRFVPRAHGKNEYRDRWIPLNATAKYAVCELLKLASERGSHAPEDYLLPHRADGPGPHKWDPARPMTSWRKAFKRICMEASKLYPNLANVKPNDLRHHVITELLENPDVSEETVVALAGWVSGAMKKVYGHVRNEPIRNAVAALERDHRVPLGALEHDRSEPLSPALTFWSSFGSTIAGVTHPQAASPASPSPAKSPAAVTNERAATENEERPKLRLVKG